MRTILATLLASGSAFLFNRAMSRGAPNPGAFLAFLVGPCVEEAAKTGFALLVAAPLLAAHAGFGVTEALYDAAGRRATGIAAGVVSLASHGALGIATVHILAITHRPLVAVLAAAAIHAVWNVLIVTLARSRRRP